MPELVSDEEKGTAHSDSPFFPQGVQFTWNLNSTLMLACYQGQSVPCSRDEYRLLHPTETVIKPPASLRKQAKSGPPRWTAFASDTSAPESPERSCSGALA